MKRQILFIQGAGAGTHDEWDARLVESLRRALGPDYEIRYPRMPGEAEPRFATWQRALADEMAALDDGALLVRHSIGGTMLIHALTQAPPKRIVGGLFLIAAPFIGEGGWASDEIEPVEDIGARLPAKTPVFVYHGSADDDVPPAHADRYEQAIPRATVCRLRGRDHQLNDDLSEVAADILALT